MTDNNNATSTIADDVRTAIAQRAPTDTSRSQWVRGLASDFAAGVAVLARIDLSPRRGFDGEELAPFRFDIMQFNVGYGDELHSMVLFDAEESQRYTVICDDDLFKVAEVFYAELGDGWHELS